VSSSISRNVRLDLHERGARRLRHRVRDGGEHLRRVRAPGDEAGEAPQRGLLDAREVTHSPGESHGQAVAAGHVRA
jgi:hypothetical protein